ncbi:MAG: hypothetical protein JO270_26850, partial [Acidobacteriaceae bacterium]|nr:hypothetical protein [Acidobacteriaceae bacterium]
APVEELDCTAATTKKPWVTALAWVLAAVAILPAIFQWHPPPAATGLGRTVRTMIGNLAALALCYWMYRVEAKRLSWRKAFVVVFLVFLFTAITNNLHSFNVDHASNYFPGRLNTFWQIDLHNLTMQLSAAALPHSYRFLPNCLVRWLELAGFGYEGARNLYRLVAGLLIYYCIYRYARLFTNEIGGILAMALVAIIYPVSFEYYAGQLTDPLSHLSFVLAFIFLETEQFGYLFATIIIGSLAKETVLALTGYYLVFYFKEKNYRVNAIALSACTLISYLGVRLFVLKGGIAYSEVSGMNPTLEHQNWHDYRWPHVVLATLGAFIPFLIVGWNETPLSLKRLSLFLIPVLFTSSVFFSWLVETRNFMPAVFVLAVIAANYIICTFANSQPPLPGVAGNHLLSPDR